MRTPTRLVALAAGGSGGHIFPARSLAEALIARGARVVLITDRRGAGFGEALPGVDTWRISAASPAGTPVERAAALARLALGYWQARRILRRLKPATVVGFGGYPSVPVVLAATRAHIPTLIHEQNAVLGRANRMLAPRVDRIATAHELVAGIDDKDMPKALCTGNPVREEILKLREAAYPAPEPHGELRLLVLGGSQGARILSEVVPEAVSRLSDSARARLRIVQQCRPEDIARVRETYAAYRVRAELSTFFEDLPERLGRCQLLIARAGASTVAELTVAGRPAILVPFAAATDDHQAANARVVAASGGAWMMREDAFRPEALAARLDFYLREPAILAQAAARARECGVPDAAQRLAHLTFGLVAGGAIGGTAGRGGRPAAERADTTLREIAA